MRLVTAPELRATIASLVLGKSTNERLGDVTLLGHQHDAVGRLERMLEEHGGALLADDVGLGKTFTALAVARARRCVLVIAPAGVRGHWSDSARRAGVRIAFESIEALSRRGAPAIAPDLVIVDEAHHFRTTHTRRFSAARELCSHAQVLLLSATPVQNRDGDLRAVLSLFLGSRAHALSPSDLVRFVVRRFVTDLADQDNVDALLPHVAPPRWLPDIDDVDCLDRILDLPAAVPPIDGNDGGVLVMFTLLRQWASSRAALTAALRRRAARGLAMRDALRAGRLPSRAELASWCHVEDTQQLSFPELVSAVAAGNASDLLAHVERHLKSVRALLDWLGVAPNPDAHRARQLLDLLNLHTGERLIAFSEYADTVAAIFRLVSPSVPAAMLTHGGGRLATGPITRAEILERFSAGWGSRAHRRDRIDVLLTTDVLSEGVNLSDASVVVHLDLVWNPARMEQRVGRVRRIDSPHRRIAVYLMPAPAPAELVLRVEERLRRKRALAQHSLGVAGAILPGEEATLPVAGRAAERLASLLREWRGEAEPRGIGLVAVVGARESGAIACVRVLGVVTLLAITEETVSDDCAAVARLCAAAGGRNASVEDRVIADIRARVERFLLHRHVAHVVDRTSRHVARTRRRLLQRAESIARGAPREQRAGIAPLLHSVRGAATARFSAGAERRLDELAEADLSDDAWLRAIHEFTAKHAARRPSPHAEIIALLILRSG